MDEFVAHRRENGDDFEHQQSDKENLNNEEDNSQNHQPGNDSLTSSIIDDYDIENDSDEEDYRRAVHHTQARASIGISDESSLPSTIAHSMEDAMAVIASISRKSVDLASSISLSSLTQHLPSSMIASSQQQSLHNDSSTSNASMININFRSLFHWQAPNNGKVHTILIVATATEIFVFEIEPHSVTHQPNLTLLSRYTEPSLSAIGKVVLLPAFAPASPSSSVSDIRLAVSSLSDSSYSFPSSAVKIYSVREHRFIHVMRHRSRVHDIIVSARHLAILLETEIIIYSITSENDATFQLMYTLKCAANPADYGICALGSRLIAYASAASVDSASASDSPVLIATSTSPTINANFPPLPPPASTSMSSKASALSSQIHSFTSSVSSEGIGAMTRDIASSLYNIGESGRKAVSAYLTPLPIDQTDQQSSSATTPSINIINNSSSQSHHTIISSHSPPSPGLSSLSPSSSVTSGGIVMIRDLTNQRVICHLKAHSSPIAALAFNPTGSLLVTAGRHGQYIHVYEIIPQPATSQTSATNSANSSSSSTANGRAVFLYRLFRGITHAVIRQISFTCDSRWVACTSIKGTVHLFAINAQGGPVTIETHTGKPRSSSSNNSGDDHSLPLTVAAIHRVRPRVSLCSFIRVGCLMDVLDHLFLLTEDNECLIFDCKTLARAENDGDAAESITEIGGPGTMTTVINTANIAMSGVHSIVNNVVEHAVKAAKAYANGSSHSSSTQHRQLMHQSNHPNENEIKRLSLQLTPVYHHSLQQQLTMNGNILLSNNETIKQNILSTDQFLALATATPASNTNSSSSHWCSHAELATFDSDVNSPFDQLQSFTMITQKEPNGSNNENSNHSNDWFDEHQKYLKPSTTASSSSSLTTNSSLLNNSNLSHSVGLNGYCEVRLEEETVDDEEGIINTGSELNLSPL